MILVHCSNTKIDEFKIVERNAVYFIEHDGFKDFKNANEKVSHLTLEEVEKNIEIANDNDDNDDWEYWNYRRMAQWNYGSVANIVEVDDSIKILDARYTFEVEDILNELEINIDAWEECFYQSDDEREETMEEKMNRYARENGYDVVIYSDYSCGDDYDSYAVVNLDIIK